MPVKYVIIDEAFPIIFGEYFEHNQFSHLNVTSAGFCSLSLEGKIKVKVSGRSKSLNLESGEDDSFLLKKLLTKMFNP